MNNIDLSWVKSKVHPRKKDGHKKSFGHVLVIGGSAGKLGAAILCARAALHSGCGMVTAMIPNEAVTPLLAGSPEIMYTTCTSLESIALVNFDAIAIGPGMGISQQSNDNLKYLLQNYNGPIVIDADALTMLPQYFNLLRSSHIITPHPGEFSRLQGFPYDEHSRVQQAHDFIVKYPSTLVLKGSKSLVLSTKMEGMMNTTGNDGMATAGSGDVLTGIIVSLCAQGYNNDIAAAIGVFVHGMAGDLAIQAKSKAGMVASDLIESLSHIKLLD